MRRPDIWQQAMINDLLVELLEFLTEDKFDFVFSQRENTIEQLVFEPISKQLPPSPDADCISLFSGGMDSLAGAVFLNEQGRRPILVSHRPRSVLAHLQQQLAAPLRERLSSWNFPHIGVWINRIGTRATEDTQRLPSAIEEQKSQWLENDKMIILLDEDDLFEILNKKAQGQDPTEILNNRIFTLRSRI